MQASPLHSTSSGADWTVARGIPLAAAIQSSYVRLPLVLAAGGCVLYGVNWVLWGYLRGMLQAASDEQERIRQQFYGAPPVSSDLSLYALSASLAYKLAADPEHAVSQATQQIAARVLGKLYPLQDYDGEVATVDLTTTVLTDPYGTPRGFVFAHDLGTVAAVFIVFTGTNLEVLGWPAFIHLCLKYYLAQDVVDLPSDTYGSISKTESLQACAGFAEFNSEIVMQLRRTLARISPDTPKYIALTGHSLGAGLAVLNALSLASDRTVVDLRLCTVACPNVLPVNTAIWLFKQAVAEETVGSGDTASTPAPTTRIQFMNVAQYNDPLPGLSVGSFVPHAMAAIVGRKTSASGALQVSPGFGHRMTKYSLATLAELDRAALYAAAQDKTWASTVASLNTDGKPLARRAVEALARGFGRSFVLREIVLGATVVGVAFGLYRAAPYGCSFARLLKGLFVITCSHLVTACESLQLASASTTM